MAFRQLVTRAVPLIVLHLAAYAMQAQPVAPVSGASPVSASASGGSYLPIFSEDASTIAFVSHANNLVTNDDSALTLDVFLSHVFSGATELISVTTNRSSGGNADALHVGVSRYALNLVFASRASNLVSNDANNAVDVFLRYRGGAAAPFTRLVSAIPQGHSPAEPIPFAPRALSTAPQIASVQDRVAFASAATNLVSGLQDTNGSYDVFVRDIFGVSPAARLVSSSRIIGMTPNGASHSPQLAGALVAFISTATDLSLAPPGLTNSNRGGDIYLHDTMNGLTYWLSQNTRDLLVGAFPAPPSTYTCFNHAIGEFRRAVVYQATPDPNSSYSNVLLYCEVGSTNPIRIATDSDPVGRPQISRSGDFVAFSSRSNVYLWSRLTGSNTLISANINGSPGNGPSHSPVMDPNGSFVAFVSKATDLVEGAPSNRFQIYAYNRVHGTNQLVTVNTNGIASMSDFELSNISIAPDNPWLIAFDSTALDLATNDFNGASDIFIRDLNSSRARLISRAHIARPARTAAPMSSASPRSISADGRRVAFTSFDSPFVSDDTNIWQDPFVRDLTSGGTYRLNVPAVEPYFRPQGTTEAVISAAGEHVVSLRLMSGAGGFGGRFLFWHDLTSGSNLLLSARASGGPLPSGNSDNASISADGNLVIFQSTTPVGEFVTNRTDGNSGSDIFARDMTSGEVHLISVNYEGTHGGNGASSNAVLSPNGRWVVFHSAADNIVYVPPGGGGISGGLPPGLLYAHDLLSNTTKVASAASNSIGSNVVAVTRGSAVFSGNSDWIGYATTNDEIYVRNLLDRTLRAVCVECDNPAVNSDARFVAYETLMNGRRQIVVKSTETGSTRLLTRSLSGGPGAGHSTLARITPDGRFIVFQSLANDLVHNDNNNASDVFVADRFLGTVLLLTINSAGAGSANGPSSRPVLSADGRKIVFQSLASDLISGDYNDRRDVFVATLAMPDSDGDGMDDDFEVAYFDNLSRDGGGDFDSDGHTDYEEFVAGTSPSDGASILRVISISASVTGNRQLVWSSVPGRHYAVQFKDFLEDQWTLMPGFISATSTTASRIDNDPVVRRFYRVIVVE